MNDPRGALRTAVGAAITAKLAGAGKPSGRVLVDPPEDQAVPYVRIGEATFTEWGTKTWEGAEVTHTTTVWAETLDEALEWNNLVVQSLTDRAAPLAVTGYTVGSLALEYGGTPIYDKQPEGTYVGLKTRIRARLKQN